MGFILKRIVTRGDATIARYGGDEFVMILPETSIDDGLAICEQIRKTIADHTFLGREWAYHMPALHLAGIISASIGIAQHIPDMASTVSIDVERTKLLKRADAAMYRAKSAGKNQVVVDQELQAGQRR